MTVINKTTRSDVPPPSFQAGLDPFSRLFSFFFFLSVDKLHIEPESIDRSLEFAGLVLDVVLGRPFLSSARSSRERDVSD